ncbi:hypothetical protein [Amycolatopsis sp. DSM 110486]|nr:hypothetical protein [Amycolatopsis sp. DSM 110486]
MAVRRARAGPANAAALGDRRPKVLAAGFRTRPGNSGHSATP